MLIRSTNLTQPSFVYPTDYGQGDRGVWTGGGNVQYNNDSVYISISTLGNTSVFGSCVTNLRYCAGTSGRGRGLIEGGVIASAPTNQINYVNIATPGSTTTFGTLTGNKYDNAAVSNGTRALSISGRTTWTVVMQGTVDYHTIATLGNASNFGSFSGSRISSGSGNYAVSDGSICIIQSHTSWNNDLFLDYWTISTPGNSTKFGNSRSSGIQQAEGVSGFSNGSRGIWAGGYQGGSNLHLIDYITFATPGNALDFGRVAHDVEYGAGVSNGTRAVIGGGNGGQMEYFNTDTATGTAVISGNFGTMTYGSHPSSRLYPAGYAGD